MSITPIYVREDWHYSANDIKEFFSLVGNGDTIYEDKRNERVKCYIKELLSRNILKTVKSKKGFNEDEEVDIDYASYSDDELLSSQVSYKYDFVGIVICERSITYSYPKYIGESNMLPKENPIAEMQQVMRVIEKYSREETKQDVHKVDLFAGTDEKGKINTLSVMLYILEDYAENGEYCDNEDILELNGLGEIYWQKTIDETYPILSKNKPYYVELYTRKKISNDRSFIKRLHAYAVTRCSREIEFAGLTNFYSLPIADISDEDISAFGGEDTILAHIDAELTQVFDDRKQMLLRALRLFFKSNKILVSDNEIQVMGTRSFNLIWENVCAKVFKSQKGDVKTHKPTVNDINPIIDYTVINKKFNHKPPILVELIPQPIWKKYGKGKKGIAKKTLNPDYLRFEECKDDNAPHKYIFYILDAKYYCPVWNDDSITNQPGIEDITKQYLYYLAFSDILEKYHVKDVRNYFLMPRRKSDVQVPGFVKLDILKKLGLGVIEIRMLDPETMYNYYLDGKTMNLSELQ